jgi:hypothetical protein
MIKNHKEALVKAKKHAEEQIIAVLKEGKPVPKSLFSAVNTG